MSAFNVEQELLSNISTMLCLFSLFIDNVSLLFTNNKWSLLLLFFIVALCVHASLGVNHSILVHMAHKSSQ